MTTDGLSEAPGGDAAAVADAAVADAMLPHTKLAYALDALSLPDGVLESFSREAALNEVLGIIKEHKMVPLYRAIQEEFRLDFLSAEDLASMEAENLKSETSLNKALEVATEDGGDVELKTALLSKAKFYCRIGDWDRAVKEYDLTREKAVGAGGKLDILLTQVRIGLLFKRDDITDKYLEIAKAECVKGGDWERRNRLRLYEGFLWVKRRQWTEAAKQLLECAPVFTATELVTFEEFVVTAVVLGILTLERPAVRQDVINGPEVNQVMAEDPNLHDFVNSLYNCDYRKFMESLVIMLKRMKKMFWLRAHVAFYARSIRVRAYEQFINPFSSVRIVSMAEAFGLPPDFLEEDVADFAANGKLNCRVDKISSVLVRTRKNLLLEQRNATLQKGDLLLNQLQKILAPLKR